MLFPNAIHIISFVALSFNVYICFAIYVTCHFHCIWKGIAVVGSEHIEPRYSRLILHLDTSRLYPFHAQRFLHYNDTWVDKPCYLYEQATFVSYLRHTYRYCIFFMLDAMTKEPPNDVSIVYLPDGGMNVYWPYKGNSRLHKYWDSQQIDM